MFPSNNEHQKKQNKKLFVLDGLSLAQQEVAVNRAIKR